MPPARARASSRTSTRACRSAVEYETRTTGLEAFDLPYRALPETDLGDVDLTTEFLGAHAARSAPDRRDDGRADRSGTINRNLAEAAQELGVGLMLGSQRVMLEDPAAAASFQVRPARRPTCC